LTQDSGWGGALWFDVADAQVIRDCGFACAASWNGNLLISADLRRGGTCHEK
jgi:hypothetical protein